MQREEEQRAEAAQQRAQMQRSSQARPGEDEVEVEAGVVVAANDLDALPHLRRESPDHWDTAVGGTLRTSAWSWEGSDGDEEQEEGEEEERPVEGRAAPGAEQHAGGRRAGAEDSDLPHQPRWPGHDWAGIPPPAPQKMRLPSLQVQDSAQDLALDPACDSCLVGAHMARLSMLQGGCATASTAGVKLILTPHTSAM